MLDVGKLSIGDILGVNRAEFNQASFNTVDYVSKNNSGMYCLGDYNSGDFAVGCFNTKSHFKGYFNKESDIDLGEFMKLEGYKRLSKLPCLCEQDIMFIKKLPNFDADIFYEITKLRI